MQVLFLMGGVTKEISDEYPLYLSEINEQLILEQQLNYYKSLGVNKFIFCIKKEELDKHHVEQVIKQLVDDVVIVPISSQTCGAVCTALLAIENIDNDEELIIVSIDDFIETESLFIVDFFRTENYDGGVVSFHSVHPRYSFVKLDHTGCANEFSEKQPISKNALVSFYYFKKGSEFVSCAKSTIKKRNLVSGSYYISQSLNEMILKQKRIGVYKIDNDKFHPLKTKQQLAQYLLYIKDVKESK